MDVQVKSNNGITLVPGESQLMANRKIFIEGEIDVDSAKVKRSINKYRMRENMKTYEDSS